jgi:hypothetical protein
VHAVTDDRTIDARVDTAERRIAMAIADPGHIVNRFAGEPVPRWSARAALIELAALHPDDLRALLDAQPNPDHVRPVRYRPVEGPPGLTYWEFGPYGNGTAEEPYSHLILQSPDRGTPGPTLCNRARFGPAAPGGGCASRPRRPTCPDCLTVSGGYEPRRGR